MKKNNLKTNKLYERERTKSGKEKEKAIEYSTKTEKLVGGGNSEKIGMFSP